MKRPETPHRPTATLIGGEFDRGADYTNWRPRGSGDWLLIHTRTGAGIISAEGRPHRLGPGEAALFAPGATQDYATDPVAGRWRLLWVHFVARPHWLGWLRWPEIAPGVSRLRLSPAEVEKRFCAALARTVALTHRRDPGMDDFALNALEEALLWAQAGAAAGKWLRADSRVRRAMDYLAAHLKEPFRLDALARHCGLSVSRLSHLFSAEIGITPQRYGEDLRLQHAKSLLSHTSLRVKEVAAEAGFADPFYFAKRFRSLVGVTPTDYRAGADRL